MTQFGAGGELQYAAVTGDLVASRDASDREAVQRETLQLIAELNRSLAEVLARPIVLTAGDEVQGLLTRPSAVMGVVQQFKDRLYGTAALKQETVFGVGWGALSTGLMAEAKSVEHLDGPCFHHARAMLQLAKKNKAWVMVEGFPEPTDVTLNALFELMGAIRAGWTPTQARYTLAMRAREYATDDVVRRVDVARELGVSPSVITESFQASRYDAIRHGERAVERILAQFDPAPPSAGEE